MAIRLPSEKYETVVENTVFARKRSASPGNGEENYILILARYTQPTEEQTLAYLHRAILDVTKIAVPHCLEDAIRACPAKLMESIADEDEEATKLIRRCAREAFKETEPPGEYVQVLYGKTSPRATEGRTNLKKNPDRKFYVQYTEAWKRSMRISNDALVEYGHPISIEEGISREEVEEVNRDVYSALDSAEQIEHLMDVSEETRKKLALAILQRLKELYIVQQDIPQKEIMGEEIHRFGLPGNFN
ncbi:hypothetical protein J4453_02695 [Candidatus Woesearchaeota archaeon]|nr:hypothetical protein [Candidatus Woesearchaeota archaeon]